MSRRKQANPQHLHSERHRAEPDLKASDAEKALKRCRMEETHICDKCCAEFFQLSELIEHKKNCTKNPPVLLMNEAEGAPEVYPKPVPQSAEVEISENKTAKGSTVAVDRMEGKPDAPKKTNPQAAPKTNGFGYLPKTNLSNTNVTLQTINSTKVAVNQHSSDGTSAPANNVNVIPMILEQLVCLQQQQLQQIQLTEQIRIQIAMMAPNSLHPSIAAATDPLKTLGAHLSQQLSTAVALIGQKAGTQNLTLEALKQSKLPHATMSIPTSATVPLSLSNSLLKPDVNKGIATSVARFPNPILPHSTGTVIFQNPLNALDAAKKLKSKFPGAATPEGKVNGEDQLFRHKCKFCGKVFGNDSALQIHLRSHTGERPYKCNICGNRFTTKGNLKVHFQRHRDKYPHIRMNPYPVPEHLDNVPTTSGIPYGMSVPLDESNVIVDTKPVLTNLPNASLTIPNVARIGDPSETSLLLNMQSKLSPSSEAESASSGAVGHESGTDQSLNSPVANGSSEQGSETTKLQQLVENIDKTGSDPNKCLICHRVLSCPSSLKMHYRTHTGERPFKCKICGRAFSTKSNLKTHYGIHRANTPQKMHSCPICQKKFTNAVVLQQHIRMHMGGQIPNTPLPEDASDDGDLDALVIDEKNGDLNSVTDENVEDIDMEDAEIEESASGSKPPTPQKESHCESSGTKHLELAPQDNAISALPGLDLQRQNSVKSSENGSMESDGLTNDSSLVGDQEYQNVKSPTPSEPRTPAPSEPRTPPAPSEPRTPVPPERRTPPAPSQPRTPAPSESKTPVPPERRTPPAPSEPRTSAPPERRTPPAAPEPRTPVPPEPRTPTPSVPRMSPPANCLGNSLSSKSPTYNGHGIMPVPSMAKLFENGTVNKEGIGALDLTNGNLLRKIKVEPGLLANGDFNRSPNIYIGPPPTLIKVEMPTDRVIGAAQFISHPNLSPSITPLIIPPRRTAKQHLCLTCNKNFSSASALQIHERTHTGEKPFACTICGRAFTTKGNLKVHVGTHMWNNSARRGRRLSVDNPVPTLTSDHKKVPEIFPKYLVPPAVGIDAAMWNQYATALSSGLAMKTNEISVIQSGGIPSLPVSNGGPANVSTASVPNTDINQASASQTMTHMEEKSVETMPKHQFPHFMEENIAVN